MVDHGKSTKRKKFHDKDKYYRLAKEQGLRSRAAFKLSQINRQYPILDPSTTNVVLDLCAAPGGWTQIAARECGPDTHIVAVDILPIRKIPTTKSNQTITTIVGDITTDKCKAEIHRAISAVAANSADGATSKQRRKQQQHGASTGLVDVVLHDGAPNVGGAYDKDAYEQMELSVHALRCATNHLKRGGTFVTKIYRSRDSTSFHWVVQQLFETVLTFKPKASRPQSAEIFYICQKYHAPQKLDPKLLDPKHIFEYVQGDTTGGGGGAGPFGTDGSSDLSKFHVFHKNWDKAKRHRGGYDTEYLDANLRHVEPLSKFVLHAKGNLQAIQLLSSCTGFSFTCEECKDIVASIAKQKLQPQQRKKNLPPAMETSCHCQFLLHHPLTTPEIKECVVDLKVLNKGDFKGLMIWRDKMLQALEQTKADDNDDEDKQSDDNADEEGGKKKKRKKGTSEGEGDDNDEDEEDVVQTEIQAMRERKLREKKKVKKKERKLAAKKRRQAALGMDLNAIEVQEDDQYFTLQTLKSAKDLAKVHEVNLDQATDEQVFGVDSDDDDDGDSDDSADDEGETDEITAAAKRAARLENDLEAAYERYLETTKNGAAKSGTKAAKRSKKLMREKLAEEAHEDQELLLSNAKGLSQDAKAYAEMLQGPKDSDDEEDDSSDDDDDDDDDAEMDDGFHSEPLTPKEHARKSKRQKTVQEKDDEDANVERNPLIHRFPDEPKSVKTARWFSNPLFASIGQAVEESVQDDVAKSTVATRSTEDSMDEDLAEGDSMGANEERTKTASGRGAGGAREPSKAEKVHKKNPPKTNEDAGQSGLDPDAILAMMPKTDKQKRHEKRLKAMERDERRQARKAKKLGEAEGDFALAPAEEDGDGGSDDELDKFQGMSEERKHKILEARKLIKAGMGSGTADVLKDESNINSFEVVDADRPLPAMDSRKYDSDNEEYDSDDYAKTMALGTMMLRRSKAKALVDASYNRYAWNDPEDLPEWFVDDENRHYRPQLPIPASLLQKMKDKVAALSVRPIAKVAEARARKNRRAKLKLASAKKKAQALAGSSEMSEAMKLKQISKALRSDDGKKSGKEYVVAKKGKKGVKGTLSVDKRMKNDKRAMERTQKKRKTGKKGGLTGSKRRRNHS